jgi:hypothetical protein
MANYFPALACMSAVYVSVGLWFAEGFIKDQELTGRGAWIDGTVMTLFWLPLALVALVIYGPSKHCFFDS